METYGKAIIDKHLCNLVTYTICDALLLTFFYEKEVLSVSDVDEIASLRKHTDKAYQFYHIIKTRPTAYRVLTDALQLTNQEGILELLKTGVVPPSLEKSARVRKLLHDHLGDRKRIRLSTKPMASAATVTGPIFTVHPPVPLFTGRRKELEELHQKVLRSGHGTPTIVSQLTSISGLGGIGKTQLCRQYVQEYRQHFDGNCVWLSAETENGLTESFLTLAKDRLGITTLDANGSNKKTETVVGEVYRFFTGRKCLFIFDNAERAPWLKQFLPMASLSPPILLDQCEAARPYVIITSRIREWDRGIEVIDLHELELGDAIALVKKGLNIEDSDTSQDDIITKLVKRLQCFPLAIQQAISFIEYQKEARDYSIQVYIQEFEKRLEELLSFDEFTNELSNDYNKTTFTTWKMTADKIGEDKRYGEAALRIMYALAYLSPDKVKRDMLSNLNGISDEEDLIGGVRLLVKYSMARGEDRQTHLSVHRLVQDVTRMELVAKQKEEEILDAILEIFHGPDKTPFNLPPENVDHLLVVWPHLWKYEELIKKYSYLPANMAWKLHERGQDDDSVRFGTECVDKLTKILGEDHVDILRTIANMTQAIYRQGRVEEALKTTRYVGEKWKGLFGERHYGTLAFMNNLGRLYYREVRFEEAYQLFQQACDIRRVEVPGEDPHVILWLENLGLSLLRLGRAEEGLKTLLDAYERRKRTPKPDKARLISIRTSVGECLNELGDFQGALKILKEDFEEIASLSGEDKIEMCDLVRMTGKVLRKMGDYEGALEVHRQAHQETMDIFGAEHQNTILCTTEIAVDLCRVGEYEDAILLLEEALAKLEALLGEGHIYIVPVQVLLADALTRQGKQVGRASQILTAQTEKIIEKGWEELEYIKNGVGRDIERIQNYIEGSGDAGDGGKVLDWPGINFP